MSSIWVGDAQSTLTAQQALRRAWLVWLMLLAVPFIVVLIALHTTTNADAAAARGDAARTWFIVVMVYFVLAVPAALFWRDHLFREYWHGRGVTPRIYLVGMTTVWVALACGGVMAALACIMSQTLSPNIAPAGVLLILYMTLWPSGRALDGTLGGSDDPEEYQEPR